ncbi:hypothetical protein SLS62_010728 [Diatrype stigma]|uniref:1-alkyl-2-acetylglycerophosphocholine esterase n=1 Tax=Diatrype stigma TaxID=117547 RepID=A0AAN9YGF2_9PEZI
MHRHTKARQERDSDQQRERPEPGPSPPKGWREYFFHTLPEYSGPYSVGFMDIELPARQPRTFSNIKRNHTHALKLETVLVSVFYPCDTSSYSVTRKKPSRATWLSRPRLETSNGYAEFLSSPGLPVTAYISATTMFTKLPAFRNAKLASQRPTSLKTTAPESSQDTLPVKEEEKPRFPIIIFSHGLGGSRTCYSAVCGELASNGFIVVAMEHRDGSGARTYVNIPPTTSGVPAGGSATDAVPERHYVVDYLWPRDNAYDTWPRNDQGVDIKLRNAQIELRMAEIEEAYYALELINNGQGDLVYRSNLRKEGNIGSSSKGLEGIDWTEWTGRMFLTDVTMMGHSFGGATTIQVVRQADRFPWLGQGILLDAWGAAMPVFEETTHERLRKPILVINSEAFMYWPENFQKIVNVCKEADDRGVPCWNLTIKGTTHLSQSDFAILYFHWMSLFGKTMANGRRSIYLTVNSSVEFLRKMLPIEQLLGTNWVEEGLLETESQGVDNVPDEHKPDAKWTAARLKIPHELRLRFIARFHRSKTLEVARDAKGKPLVGVKRFVLGDEIWMHCSPTSD